MPVFGGQTGEAEKALKGRKSRLDQAEEDANSTTPKEDTKKEEKPAPRPPMSKKWYE